MYRVPPFRPRLYLLRVDGARREFEHVEAAARQLTGAFLRDEVGRSPPLELAPER